MVYMVRIVPAAPPAPPAPTPPAPTTTPGTAEDKLLSRLITESKRFRALLDEKSLSDAIDTMETELDSDEWWAVEILEGNEDALGDLFDRVLGEGTGWEMEAEKNKWIWKRFFDDMIRHYEDPGAPENILASKDIDRIDGEVKTLDQKVDALIPTPSTPLVPEPLPETWPEAAPTFPSLPIISGEETLPEAWVQINAIRTYLAEERAYYINVLFNMSWCLEQIRVCLSDLSAAKAPGTQEDAFKANLKGLADGMFQIETDGVFHD